MFKDSRTIAPLLICGMLFFGACSPPQQFAGLLDQAVGSARPHLEAAFGVPDGETLEPDGSRRYLIYKIARPCESFTHPTSNCVPGEVIRVECYLVVLNREQKVVSWRGSSVNIHFRSGVTVPTRAKDAVGCWGRFFSEEDLNRVLHIR